MMIKLFTLQNPTERSTPMRHAGILPIPALMIAISFLQTDPARAANQTASKSEFVSLFDGKSLAGWKQIKGNPKVWKVENGSLVMDGDKGGWLATNRTYADFELELEFKYTAESNSGIYLRAPGDDSHISRTGMEIQILDDSHPRYKEIKGWQKTGALYHIAEPREGHLRPAGEWNRMGIRLEGKSLVITLNGAKVVEDRLDSHPELEAEHTGLKRKDGHIGLQSHNGRVEFRNIRVRELGEKSAKTGS